MLFCTSLVALVGAPDPASSTPPSPRKLLIVNTKVSQLHFGLVAQLIT